MRLGKSGPVEPEPVAGRVVREPNLIQLVLDKRRIFLLMRGRVHLELPVDLARSLVDEFHICGAPADFVPTLEAQFDSVNSGWIVGDSDIEIIQPKNILTRWFPYDFDIIFTAETANYNTLESARSIFDEELTPIPSSRLAITGLIASLPSMASALRAFAPSLRP